jgi:amino acid adenylation domain-containing protein
MTEQTIQGFPLSPQQKAAWRAQTESEAGAVVQWAVSVSPPPTADRLAEALERLVDRFEILRTRFVRVPGVDHPFQVIDDDPAAPPRVITSNALAEAGAAAEARPGLAALAALAETDAARGFDLETGPAFRVTLAPLAGDDAVVLVTASPLVADPGSLRLLTDRLLSAAELADEDDDEELQYVDLAQWLEDSMEEAEAQPVLDEWRSFWSERRLNDLLERPAPLAAAGRAAGGATDPSRIERAVAVDRDALAAAARAWGVGLDRLLLAAWMATVAMDGDGAVEGVVGVASAGRRFEELEDAVGPLERWLPVVVAARPDETVEAVVRRLDDDLSWAVAREERFEARSAGGSGAGTRGFPVTFSAPERLEWTAGDGAHRPVLSRRIPAASRLDLAVTPDWDGGWRLVVSFDPGSYDARTADLLAGRLAAVLERSTGGLGAPRIADLDVTGVSERAWLLEVGTTPGAAPSAATLPGAFAARVAASPDAVAVSVDGRELTFAQVAERAARLAHHLRALGVGLETPVALAMDRSEHLVPSILGVLAAGGTYVPVDPTHPAARLEGVLDDVGARVVVASGELEPDGWARGRTVVDPAAEEIARRPATWPDDVASPESLAYIIYTSGSSGVPKGVAVSHRAPLVLLEALRRTVYSTLGPGPHRVSLNAPVIFDASLQQLVMLVDGHTLCLVPEDVRVDGEAFLAYLERERVEVLDCTPSQLYLLVAAGLLDGDGETPTLVLSAGEAIGAELWGQLRAGGGPRVINLYGPTEATVDATFHPVGREGEGDPGLRDDEPTIGRPLPGYGAHVVSSGADLVRVGRPGELLLAGDALARGYVGRPALTAERFVPDPFAPGAGPGRRLYRTGDRVRRRVDGRLDFVGRIDFQVKVRGYRIELGEIEAVLESHPAVERAVVVVRGDGAANHLVAYVQSPDGAARLSEELGGHLAGRLPDYMVPGVRVVLPELPLTPSGKVDRRSLPEPSITLRSTRSVAAPETEVEKILARAIEQVLDSGPIGLDDNFFSLGGDSIRSLQVQSVVRQRGYTFTVQDLFEHQSVRALAAVVTPTAGARILELLRPFQALSDEARAEIPEGIEDAYPMTMVQRGMVYHTELDRQEQTGVYQDIFSFTVAARFDPELLQAALDRVAARHPVLRTSFALFGYDEPLQLVHERVSVPLGVEDLRGLDGDEQEAVLARYREAEKVLAFDWSEAPLWRVAVHRLTDDTFRLTVTEHHSILDGWSMAALLTQLHNLYDLALTGGVEALDRLEDEEIPQTFRDAVAMELAALASDESRRYWLDLLSDAPPTRLPHVHVPPEEVGYLSAVHVELSDEHSDALRRAATDIGVPLKSLALAVHLRVLSLISGQRDVVTGVPYHGRPEVDGADKALGLFVTVLPLRLELADETWGQLTRRAFEAEREMLAHRHFPLAAIQQLLGRQELFDVSFNFIHFHVYQEAQATSEIAVGDRRVFERTDRPLSIGIGTDPFNGRLELRVSAHGEVMTAERLDEIVAYLVRALEAAADPDAPSMSPLLSAAERQTLLAAGRRPAAVATGPGSLVDRVVFDRAAKSPEALAVVHDPAAGVELTYGELARRARALGRHLVAAGVGVEDRVAVHLPRGPELIVSLLGVMAAGAAYVPLDPTYPTERLRQMIDDTEPAAVLGFAAGRAGLPTSVDHWLDVHVLGAEEPPADARLPSYELRHGDQLAYVLFTSGSTGRPKGVMATHGAVVHQLAAMAEEVGWEPGHRSLQFAATSFDASVFDIFGPLHVGCELHTAPVERLLPGPELDGLLRERSIQHLQTTPTVLAALTPPTDDAPLDLLTLTVAGETCPAGLLTPWAAPGRRLINAYGPTEATVCSSSRVVERPEERPPIGGPTPRTRLSVVGPELDLVPVGVRGELWIGGGNLTRGYWNRPAHTAEQFVPDPFAPADDPGARAYRSGDLVRWLDGLELDFLGRVDRQLEVRGMRVEPGEVEAALLGLAGVREAVVIGWDRAARGESRQPGAEDRLVAYVAGPEVPSAADLREHLASRLPPYLVPAAFVEVDTLPRAAGGKLDVARLPSPENRSEQGQEQTMPRTPTERRLAELWAESLRVDRVGVHETFLELGGHSIVAVQLIVRIREAFEVDLPMTALFETPTVAEMSARIVDLKRRRPEAASLEEMLASLEELSDDEVRARLAEARGEAGDE